MVVGILAVQTLIAYAAGEKQGATHGEEETERFDTVMRMLAVEIGQGLRTAITNDDVAAVRYYLEVGADANYKDDNGITPLGEAISDIEKRTNPKIVELLLKKGADPKALWGDYGTTPFFYLVQLSTSSSARQRRKRERKTMLT